MRCGILDIHGRKLRMSTFFLASQSALPYRDCDLAASRVSLTRSISMLILLGGDLREFGAKDLNTHCLSDTTLIQNNFFERNYNLP